MTLDVHAQQVTAVRPRPHAVSLPEQVPALWILPRLLFDLHLLLELLTDDRPDRC